MRTDQPQAGAKVVVIGAGAVGATFAYAAVLRGVAREIVLLDVNRAKAEGEAMDLNHALPFAHPAEVMAGDYPDCKGADVIVITAGAAQKPGQTRLDLAVTNVNLMRQIVPSAMEFAAQPILLMVSNPLDVLTYAAYRLSGLPANRVIGSGTVLDTARFRYVLAQQVGVDPRNVHAYIIGEHGDSEVAVWSSAAVAGVPVREYLAPAGKEYGQPELRELFLQVRNAAYEIIQRKGATYYAIGVGVAALVESILRNQHSVFTVSSLLSGQCGASDVCLSLPTVLARDGVERVIEIALSPDESAAFGNCAQIVKEVIRSVGL